MLYNKNELPKVAGTAGKITILTALVAVAVFVTAFLFDTGANQIGKTVHATGTATTTLTVLNTPPTFTVPAYEFIESSTTTPTNSGDTVEWRAIANDTNDAPYFLLICSTNASPTASNNTGGLGTAPPSCNGGTQWAVSTSTASDAEAIAATTTTEVAPFFESNDWYAWVCDDDPVNARCSVAFSQGISATNSSPFNVNRRPVLSAFGNNGPVDPGGTLVFSSTSTDPDSVDEEDDIFLVVCQSAGAYNTVTNTCDDPLEFLASTTIALQDDATATYTLAAIVRDDNYPAFGFLVDEHGHEALANPIQQNFDVNNVAPEVLGGDITLNDGSAINLTEAGGETLGFTLDFVARDANSCVDNSVLATDTGPFLPGELEIVDYTVALYRSAVGTSTCDGTLGAYNPNNCYTSGAAPATWNLSCTASSTSCTGAADDTILYECTFPLWFVADPTDAGPNTPASLEPQNWLAAVSAIDDDAAAGPFGISAAGVELVSFTFLDLVTDEIVYGALEPGTNNPTLSATTTARNLGNTGLDQEVEGESMCPTFAVGSECVTSSTSTIPENQQQFSSSSLAYNDPSAIVLSSSTPNEVELNIEKTVATSTPTSGITYWGIAVPISITLAGDYTGLNTFYAVTAEGDDWGAAYPN